MIEPRRWFCRNSKGASGVRGECRDSVEDVKGLFWEFPEVAFSAGSIGPLAALAEVPASLSMMADSLWGTTSRETWSTPRVAVAIKWRIRRVVGVQVNVVGVAAML